MGQKRIEELSAQLADKDRLIERQSDEIQRLRRDVKRQQDKLIELAKKLPKRGEWIHGKELSRAYIGNCCVGIVYEDFRCSACGVVVEDCEKPKWKYCPNCGAKMEVQDADT